MSLIAYRAKRRFSNTPEPRGGGRRGAKPRFVVQKHAATNLHYDVRLEIGGVLKSWAVPKGPSLNPRVKRLAIATEDHPLAYGDFEGVIPDGEYGAGAVMVWDRGWYRSLKPDSMRSQYRRGEIEVVLHGKKLRGAFAFVRFGGDNNQWLLIKMNDIHASARRNPVARDQRSVVSGRTMREIERAYDD